MKAKTPAVAVMTADDADAELGRISDIIRRSGVSDADDLISRLHIRYAEAKCGRDANAAVSALAKEIAKPARQMDIAVAVVGGAAAVALMRKYFPK